MGSYFEIWTRPGDPNFGRVIDDPPFREATIHDAVNLKGDGTMQIPNSFDRFDDILKIDGASSTASLVRVRSDIDDSVTFEWMPRALVPTSSKTDPYEDLSGRGIKQILEFPKTEAFDWDGTDDWQCVDCDWIWGSGNNLLRNPGFEDQAFPNGGFELGTTDYWQVTVGDGFLTSAQSLTAVENAAEAQAGDWYGLVNPGGSAKSGVTRSFSGLEIGETYTITGFLLDPTSSGDRWRAGVGDVATATHTNAYEADGYWWAELGNATQGNGSSDGTWQTFTLTFVAALDRVQLVVIYDTAGAGPNFRIDSWDMSGPGVGLHPWEAKAPGNQVDRFEISTSVFRSGAQSVLMQGDAQVDPGGLFPGGGFSYPGIQQAATLREGKTYTFVAWVYHESGSDEEFGMTLKRRSLRTDDPDYGDSVMVNAGATTVPTHTWTKMEGTGVSDVSDAQIQIVWRYAGALDSSPHQSPVFYVDDTEVAEGLPATTIGDIITLLYNHATNADLRDPITWDDGQGTDTPYLTLDFGESDDSAGNAWDDDEVRLYVYMRMSLYQVLTQLADSHGIEFRVVPDDVEAGTWLLQVYDKGSMSTVQDVAIQGGANDVRRMLRRFLPDTHYIVEGRGRVAARAADDDLGDALGRMEAERLDRELPSEAAVQGAADEDAADAEAGVEPWSYELVDPQDQPGTAYILGDEVAVHDPPEADGQARFWEYVATFTPEAETWEVDLLREPETSP